MEDTGMEESLDAGSIPASSIRKGIKAEGFGPFSYDWNQGIERRGRGAYATREGPGGSFSPSGA